MNSAMEEKAKAVAAFMDRVLGGSTQEPEAPEPAPPTREELLARGWAMLRESYRIPEVAPTLEEARAWCKHLAETHHTDRNTRQLR